MIPHLIDGLGWKTIIALNNLEDVPATYTLTFIGEDGTPQTYATNFGNVSTITGSLAAHGSVTIETAGVKAELTQGWANLDTVDTAAVGGTVVFRRVAGGQPNYEASEPIDGGLYKRYAMPFDHMDGSSTGIAIVNPITFGSATIQFIFRDESGVQLFVDTFMLPAMNHVAITFTQRYPQLAGKRGSFEVSASTLWINVLAVHTFPTGSFTTIVPLVSGKWF